MKTFCCGAGERGSHVTCLDSPEPRATEHGQFTIAASTLDTAAVLLDIEDERRAQDIKWGEQNHANGTGSDRDVAVSETVRRETQDRFDDGIGTWRDILKEEVYEAFAESDPVLLRTELVQVAAVATGWIECLDRHHTQPALSD